MLSRRFLSAGLSVRSSLVLEPPLLSLRKENPRDRGLGEVDAWSMLPGSGYQSAMLVVGKFAGALGWRSVPTLSLYPNGPATANECNPDGAPGCAG